ncbi:MAG: serine/threonine protein kinase [Candidatus Loosdrechtia sp.]|uniref:serine/threonine protein kinase n=1 Tax=Candidatus Loosdrechtia sp. TaxID=3101272 RepID=UPI003A75B6EA|nr:MAG: protein kinase [Candidatus Jettenia sp. AMX2]
MCKVYLRFTFFQATGILILKDTAKTKNESVAHNEVVKMHSINTYLFKEFKHTPGHRANYAILCNAEFKENQWGIKYSPVNAYPKEYKILSAFSHPQIPVQYKEGTDMMYRAGKPLIIQNYIILSHCEGEDVVDYYKKRDLPDQQEIQNLIEYFSSITLPLHYLHSKGYIHSDIKPGHLILNPHTRTISLIDLECAIKTGDMIRGMSKEYASPEQKQMIRLLRNRSESESDKSILKKIKLTATSDLYSLGLILYQVATSTLWQETAIAPGKINKAIPDTLNRIILGLLEEEPGNRISSSEELQKELKSV